ncbi:META domain-containing protein [Moraxella oblonga]|uniref:META domain-containing protein n=1 Tax=Moraxella oblonga TaxID=200413 RepID=UPI00146FEA8A|nr:META domain-containing protein [Moraxella oblonga]
MTMLWLNGCACVDCQLKPSLPSVSTSNILTSSTWQLVKVERANNPLLSKLDYQTVLYVDELYAQTAVLHANMGCNTITVPVVLQHGRMALDKTRPTMSTEMYCADKDDVERIFFEFMTHVERYQLMGNQLILTDSQNQRLVLTKHP